MPLSMKFFPGNPDAEPGFRMSGLNTDVLRAQARWGTLKRVSFSYVLDMQPDCFKTAPVTCLGVWNVFTDSSCRSNATIWVKYNSAGSSYHLHHFSIGKCGVFSNICLIK